MSQPSPTVSWTRSQLPRLLALLALAAAVVLLVGCGGTTPASDVAAKEHSQEQKAETKFAGFARCLREHGVNAEAVSHPGGGHGIEVRPGNAGASPAAVEAAEKACAHYRPEPQKVNFSPQQTVEREEAVQKFAKCMREHGIKVEASTSGIEITAHGGPASPNPESGAFRHAQRVCEKLLPGGGPGGS